MRRSIILLATIAAMLLTAVLPALAQESYPPGEDDDVLGEVIEETEEEEEAEAEADVRGVALEDTEGLPATGATVTVLGSVGLIALVLGGGLVLGARRRERQHA